jgi:multidrug transporter EmrE-like cation transporter
MYIRYMLIAFFANGLGAFGLRILAGAGLGKVPATNYLSLWYLSGFVIAALVYFSKYKKFEGRELLIGGLMALCSVCGQLGMALALEAGIDGVVVYPVAIGGGMLFVVAVGIGIFHEPMSWLGYAGIATGAAALVLLAIE